MSEGERIGRLGDRLIAAIPKLDPGDHDVLLGRAARMLAAGRLRRCPFRPKPGVRPLPASSLLTACRCESRWLNG